MKKTLCLMLTTVMLFMLCSCGGKNEHETEEGTKTCDTCDATGKIWCSHCNGKGVCQYKCGLCSDSALCKICDGTRRFGECYDCHGNGQRKALFRVYHNGKKEFIYYLDD